MSSPVECSSAVLDIVNDGSAGGAVVVVESKSGRAVGGEQPATPDHGRAAAPEAMATATQVEHW